MKKPNVLKNIIVGLVVLVLVTLTINFLFSGSLQIKSLQKFKEVVFFGLSIGLPYWLGNWAIGSLVAKKLDWNKNPQKANTISLFAFIVFGILISPIAPLLYEHYVWGNSGRGLYFAVLTNAFIGFTIDMIFISIYFSRFLSKAYHNAIIQNEALKHENLLAKYEALKNQVNPHFLFNSLNTLSGVIEQKPEHATIFVQKLSKIYRYVLELQHKDIVSLEDELKFIDDYIYLVKTRFGEALQFHNKVGQNNSIYIVPLALQILVENAIKHNIVSDTSNLIIELSFQGQYLEISNNLQKKKAIKSNAQPIGLENLKNRYAYLCNQAIEILEENNKFKVRIPIIKKENHDMSGN